jgi:hypothetical protein
VDPVFGVKFLDSLGNNAQDFDPFCRRKVRIFSNQGKESVVEVWIHQDALVLVGIHVHPQPTRACKLQSELLGQIIEGLRHVFEDKRLISTPEWQWSDFLPPSYAWAHGVLNVPGFEDARFVILGIALENLALDVLAA